MLYLKNAELRGLLLQHNDFSCYQGLIQQSASRLLSSFRAAKISETSLP